MTWAALREKILVDMIASIERHETRDFRKQGCLAGLAICRTLETNDDFVRAIRTQRAKAKYAISEGFGTQEYWRERCASAQIEFFYERFRVAHRIGPTFSAQAALHVERLMRDA